LFGLNWRTGCDGLVQFASGAKSATIVGTGQGRAYGDKALKVSYFHCRMKG